MNPNLIITNQKACFEEGQPPQYPSGLFHHKTGKGQIQQNLHRKKETNVSGDFVRKREKKVMLKDGYGGTKNKMPPYYLDTETSGFGRANGQGAGLQGQDIHELAVLSS